MMMKKLIILFAFLSLSSVFGQRGSNEKIKALKTAHITDALDLTPAEAEKFWPVFNDYEERMQQLRKNERREIMSVVRSGINSLSEADANEVIDKMLEYKSLELEYQEELVNQLRKVISPQKILRLRKAEDDFRKMLVERLRHHKGKS